MRTIALVGKRGADKFAVVSDEDYAELSQSRWFWSRGYALRVNPTGYPPGPPRKGEVRPPKQPCSIAMHRVIMGLTFGDPLQVDHINRDTLDNRRENLRYATTAQNQQNKCASRGSTSSYRGVSWNTAKQRWVAQVKFERKVTWLGLFDDELEAARVAQQARLVMFPYAVEEIL